MTGAGGHVHGRSTRSVDDLVKAMGMPNRALISTSSAWARR